MKDYWYFLCINGKRRLISILQYQNHQNRRLYSEPPLPPPSVDVLQKMARVDVGWSSNLRIFLHKCYSYNSFHRSRSKFCFNQIDFQLYTDFPLQFCVFFFSSKSLIVTQRSISQEIAFKKSKYPSPFLYKTTDLNNSFTLIENNFRFFKIVKFEFKATAHYGLWTNRIQVWPSNHLFEMELVTFWYTLEKKKGMIMFIKVINIGRSYGVVTLISNWKA